MTDDHNHTEELPGERGARLHVAQLMPSDMNPVQAAAGQFVNASSNLTDAEYAMAEAQEELERCAREVTRCRKAMGEARLTLAVQMAQ